MPAPKVRADHPQLTAIAAQFGTIACTVGQMSQHLKQQKEALQGGDWVGAGADKFYAEMDAAIIPSLARLVRTLELAGQIVRKISELMQWAEEEAASLFEGGEEPAPVSGGDMSGGPNIGGGGSDGIETPVGGGGAGGEGTVGGGGGGGTGQPGTTKPRPVDVQGIAERIESHEGRKKRVYPDKKDNPSIGVGFNLNRAGARQRLQKLGYTFDDVYNGRVELLDIHITKLRDEDVRQAITDSRDLIPSFDSLSPERQRAIVDLAFAGKGVLQQFVKLREAIAQGDWERAARELKNSKWAKQVQPQRVEDDYNDLLGNTSDTPHDNIDISNIA